jgi:DNA modification methylase
LITAKPGDVIIDVFGGSGTTSKVANELGFDSVIYETDPKYIDIIKKRVKQ